MRWMSPILAHRFRAISKWHAAVGRRRNANLNKHDNLTKRKNGSMDVTGIRSSGVVMIAGSSNGG